MKALKDLNLNNLVFIDIETARVEKEINIDSQLFDAWKYVKGKNGESNDELVKLYNEKAGLDAEFARVACITVGRIKGDEFYMRSYSNENEMKLLREFVKDLNLVTDNNPKTALCGHAIIGFDVPFLMKRCLANQIEPHKLLDTAHLKPWETTSVDTMVLWRGTAFNTTSLIAVATCLGLPSPKDDISGAEVGDIFWSGEEGSIERIVKYCEKDVLTVAQIVRRCRFEPLLTIPEDKAPNKTPVDIEKLPLIQKLFDGGKYGASEKKELQAILAGLTEEERESAFIILDAMTSTARDKKTVITKAHVKALK